MTPSIAALENLAVDLRGIFPPVPTPFRDEMLNLDALGRNLDRWVRTGIRGIVVLGSNGEAPLVSDDEADRVVGSAREHIPPAQLLIAGTGRESTVGTIAACRRAAAGGADAVLVRTPSYFKGRMTHEALRRHYEAVADASPVPVILYNFFALTGVNLLPETVAALSAHPNVIGVKESGSDLAQVGAILDARPAGFAVIVGSAPTLYASLCLGADAAIVALACVVPELCVRLHELAVSGRHADARVLQRQVTPLARLITTMHGVPGLKAALDLAGYTGGAPRLPLLPVTEAARREIEGALQQLEQLV